MLSLLIITLIQLRLLVKLLMVMLPPANGAGKRLFNPAGLYFYQQKFSAQFHSTVRAFKSVLSVLSILSRPSATSQSNSYSLEEFRNFPFFDNDDTIANLARELPGYLAAADGVVMGN